MDTSSAARNDLEGWRAAFPSDPYTTDAALRRILAGALDDRRLAALDGRASEFARHVVAIVGPAARRYEHRDHLPELVRWDGVGRRVERVEFDPTYQAAGAAVWRSGLVALSGESGRAFEQATLLYLLSLEGEAGHACPATCTIGLARALRRAATDDVRERFLPPLLEPDYAKAQRGSQFLTEVQGGGDVGANACAAIPQADGSYRISGEKWFCSVADADQFLVTARVPDGPEGTRGLGCFVMPRLVDGSPNGFVLRRLKEKLGTRGMASGEIDFDDATAWSIGPVDHGFRTAVGVVLNTSRWMTAVGSAGTMRRAVLEATTYARHRRAFGQLITDFPAVRVILARMRAAWLGALHLAFALTDFEDRIDAGTADEADVLVHRFLVNATKYVNSIAATTTIRDAIEVFGGNGTIEEFSVLPRLYRDAIVYESWEGTHNVLVAQVLNDLRRLPILDAIDAYGAEVTADGPPGIDRLFGTALAHTRHAIDDADFGAWHFRSVLDRIAACLQVGLVHREEPAAAEHLLHRDADDDRGARSRVDAVLADA